MQVRIHPSSINSQLSVPDSSSADSQDCPIILFEEITRGEAQLYVRQCTLASPHALLLVAAHLALSQEDTQHDDPTGLPFMQLPWLSCLQLIVCVMTLAAQHCPSLLTETDEAESATEWLLTCTASQHSKAASTDTLIVFAAAEGQHVRYDDDGEVAAAAAAGSDAKVSLSLCKLMLLLRGKVLFLTSKVIVRCMFSVTAACVMHH